MHDHMLSVSPSVGARTLGEQEHLAMHPGNAGSPHRQAHTLGEQEHLAMHPQRARNALCAHAPQMLHCICILCFHTVQARWQSESAWLSP